jgi:hypothetical protein
MSIRPELLDMLVCPACRKPVKLTAQGDALKCAECRRLFPIRDGFPVMILDEARVDSE